MADRNKQWMMRLAWEALREIDSKSKLLELIVYNGEGTFKLTDDFRKKYVQTGEGEFRGYARYASDLDKARKELLK